MANQNACICNVVKSYPAERIRARVRMTVPKLFIFYLKYFHIKISFINAIKKTLDQDQSNSYLSLSTDVMLQYIFTWTRTRLHSPALTRDFATHLAA